MMDDLMFTLDMEGEGLVPDVFHAPGVGELTALDHGYYGEDFNFYPPVAHCMSSCTDFASKPVNTCCDPYMSESALISENGWEEETQDLSNFLRHEALSPSPERTPPSGWETNDRIKSPMELFKEIEQEASQFTSAGQSPVGSPVRSFTDLTPVEGVPAEMFVMESEVEMVPEVPRQLNSEEVNAILESQIPYLQTGVEVPAADQEVVVVDAGNPNVQVVQIVGDQVVFPDGTRAVIVTHPDGVPVAPADVEAAAGGSEPKKKRTYQKGGYERKKKQNRESAHRYRMKLKEIKEMKMSEFNSVSSRNQELKSQVNDLEREIIYWKKFIADLQS